MTKIEYEQSKQYKKVKNMPIRMCKKIGMTVEFSGYCEFAEECINDININCTQCTPAIIRAGIKAIKEYNQA